MERRLCPVCGKEVKAEAKFCSSCGSNLAERVQPTPSVARAVRNPLSRKAKRVYGTLIALLFGFFLYLFVVYLPGGAHPVIANQPEVAMATMYMGKTITPEPIQVDIDGGRITFALSTVLQYHAVAFDVKTPTGIVPLLAYVSPEGKLVTSIRMCEPCNSKKFTIEGTELACGNCETRWNLNNLEGVQGTCQKYPPDPIPSTVDGNRVIIEESVVRNWKMRI